MKPLKIGDRVVGLKILDGNPYGTIKEVPTRGVLGQHYKVLWDEDLDYAEKGHKLETVLGYVQHTDLGKVEDTS